MTSSDNPISRAEMQQRDLLCVLLRLFYAKDWVSGTGGGICARLGEENLLVAPTGVHKELVEPGDLVVVQPASGTVVRPASNPALRPSECTPIFGAIVRMRGAGSVMHSHALSAVLAADLAHGDSLAIERLEMLKGVRGVANTDRHVIPVIDNTPTEPALTGAVEEACADLRFTGAAAILVRDHGAYIWGADAWEAKRHAEVYHFLFDALVARAHRHQER